MTDIDYPQPEEPPLDDTYEEEPDMAGSGVEDPEQHEAEDVLWEEGQ